MTSIRLQQNLNVLFFQCALTAQMAQKFKSSEPNPGHVTRKISPLYFKRKMQQWSKLYFTLNARPEIQILKGL